MKYFANVLYLITLVFVSPWILYRLIRFGRYRKGWKEKILGIHPLIPPNLTTSHASTTGKVIWFHAVSVGEVQLLRTVVAKFQQERPDLRLVVSTSTDSGFALAQQLFPSHQVTFAPYDFSWAIRNTWKTIRPSVVVLMELEIWPNWLRTAEKEGCPVLVVNGRLSEKSFRGYSRIRFWMAPILQTIDWIGAQNEEYAERFRRLGAKPDSVQVTGSIKFDGAVPDREAPEVVARREWLGLSGPTVASDLTVARASRPESQRPLQASPPGHDSRFTSEDSLVWVAGSTQAPEEEIVLQAFSSLVLKYPKLRLILVPRHPERFEQVAQLIANLGIPWERRSETMEEAPPTDWKIFLGDSVGELRWWWGLADIGFVGGSFGDRGGQNMIEPCAYRVATSFGPNTKNFKDIVRLLLQDQAAEQLETPAALTAWVERMICDEEARETLGGNAKSLVEKHRGAIDRTWEGIEPFLPKLPG